MNVETVPIDSVSPDPANARTHNERNLEAIKASLRRFGLQKPLVVGKDNVIRAGNGTWLAAKALGWKEIAIARTELDGVDATAYSIADNRTGELAGWDDDVLASTLAMIDKDESFDLSMLDLGFTQENIDDLLRASSGNGETHEDEVPAPKKEAVSQTGDLWLLGSHRLLCGDSTSKDDVALALNGSLAKIVSTDPPYLVDYTGDSRLTGGKDWSGVYHEIEIDDARKFFENAVENAVENAAFYWWHAHKRASLVESVFEKFGIFVHQQIVWVKPSALHGYSFYPWKHEPCYFGWRKGNKPSHDGDTSHRITTVWDLDWEGKSGNEHPAQKPLEVFAIPMRKHTVDGDVCYEPFSGSGSQIIAAEQLNRRCYAIEIEPVFVDVAVRRWQNLSGKDATLEGTEKTFAQIAEERGIVHD